jgi:serpin B
MSSIMPNLIRKAGLAAAVAASVVATFCAREAVAQDHDARERALVDAYDASGVALFKEFSAKPGNIVFSPYSIGTAMAMVLAGARGDTERETAAVLKQTLGRDQIADANGTVRATLMSDDKSGAKSPPSVSLLIANALMLGPRGDLVSDDYTALLKDKYDAEIFKNAGLDAINGWVNRKTQGNIDRIIDRLDPNNVATLLDAVYFKAKWAAPFRKERTAGARFDLSPGQHADVPTMHQSDDMAIATRAGYRAIRLPYAIGSLGMIILLPDAIDGAAPLAQRLDAREWAEVAAALHDPANEKFVDLALPRFKTKFGAELAPLFARQGMIRALDPKLADFSGISGKPPSQAPLFISSIVHRAMIDVMEEGTEAAAVTGVGVAKASVVRRPSETFRVDHPFLFAITDDATGAILFQGRITDPR